MIRLSRLAKASELQRDKTENLQVPGKQQRTTSLSELLSRLASIHHSRPTSFILAQRAHPELDALFASLSSNP
ncbi:hypothetical protein A2U01_0077272 [Trifolium medium]|uniref:Uncharacterized protein n=1 Tax=Trifolium medium TaxID=97028 RepID=A0A392T4H4_9FABA|nr:hypothetical protein [Trifolium medium]